MTEPAALRPITVALIGAGGMAVEHLKAFRDIEGVEVVGVTAGRRASAEAFAAAHGVAVVAEGVDDLFARTRADLAVVAVPEVAIAPVLGAALAKPWTIAMEKPIGVDAAEAEAIAAAARAAGRAVFVGLNRRCLSSTRAVLADLADDPGPRFVHVQDQQSLETARAIGHPERVVAAWMYANSIHLVDYLAAFCRGAPVEVRVIEPWRPEAPGVVLATVRFDSGDLGLYEAIWHGPGPWACTVTTPRRRWELRPLERAQVQNAGERRLTALEPDAWDAAFKPGFREQAGRIVAALRGLDAPAPVTLEEALITTRLVRDIYAAPA